MLQILFEVLEVPAKSPISAAYMALRNSHEKEDYWRFKEMAEGKLEFVQGHYQQDAQEFLRGLLEVLNQENRVSSTQPAKKAEFTVNPKFSIRDNWHLYCKQLERFDNSLIVGLFAGELHIELRCQLGHTKYRFERFMDLSLPFKDTNNSTNISAMLKGYFSEEFIEGVECELCHKKGKARRRMSVYHLPNVLVLHLNRFYQGMYNNTKIKTNVGFDQIMEMPK